MDPSISFNKSNIFHHIYVNIQQTNFYKCAPLGSRFSLRVGHNISTKIAQLDTIFANFLSILCARKTILRVVCMYEISTSFANCL